MVDIAKARTLEEQHDSKLGDEGREIVKHLRDPVNNWSNGYFELAAAFIEQQAAQLAALTALPEDVAGLCERLKLSSSSLCRGAYDALRAQHAELARRDRVDAENVESAAQRIYGAMYDGNLPWYLARSDDQDCCRQYARAAILDTAKPAEARTCQHEWVDARNKYVLSGEVCLKCYAIRAGNQPAEARSTPDAMDPDVVRRLREVAKSLEGGHKVMPFSFDQHAHDIRALIDRVRERDGGIAEVGGA